MILFFVLVLTITAHTSVLEFGYNSSGSGVAEISTSDFTFRDKTKSIPDSSASKYTPLHLDEILVYAKKVGPDIKLVFFDTDSWKTKKEEFVARGTLASMPTTDTKTIYLLAHSEKRRLLMQLHSFDLLTRKTTTTDIDLLNIYQKSYPKVSGENLERLIGCKTALKIYKDKIYFGCSIPIDYGEYRGIRGLVVSVDKTGAVQTFFTSKITSNPMTGYNSGVYHSGGGFSFLPPDNIYVLTGNGPSFPKEDNYGCAILRLDLNLKVKESLLVDDEKYNECFSHNLDFSTSSAAIAGTGTDYLGVTKTSSGMMQIFDPLNLTESKIKVPGVVIGNDDNFGQANIIAKGNGKFQFFIQGNPVTTENERFRFVVATHDEKNVLASQGYVQGKCLGHLLPDEKSSVSFYYSGKYKGNYVLLKDSDAVTEEIQGFRPKILKERVESFTKDFMSPYVKLKVVSLPGKFKTSARKIPLSAIFEGEFYNMTEGILEGIIPASEDVEFRDRLKQSVKFNVGNIISCSEKTDLPKLYLYSRQKSDKPGSWNILSYEFDKKTSKLTKLWEFTETKDTQFPHSHMATAIHDKSKTGFIVIPVTVQGENATDVIFLNVTNGKLLKRIQVPGVVHFSMPLITHKKIYIPTTDQGIQVIESGR